jgi:hypothetical protein
VTIKTETLWSGCERLIAPLFSSRKGIKRLFLSYFVRSCV